MNIVRRVLRKEPQPDVAADQVDVQNSMVRTVHAEKALLSRSIVGTVTAADNAVLTTSGALSLSSASDIVVTAGGGMLLIAKDDIHMQGGGGGIVVAKEASVESGMVGILLAGNARLGNKTRVLINTREAVVMGVVIGCLWPITRYLLRRYGPKLPERSQQAERESSLAARIGFWLLRKLITLAALTLAVVLAYRWLRSKVGGMVPIGQ